MGAVELWVKAADADAVWEAAVRDFKPEKDSQIRTRRSK